MKRTAGVMVLLAGLGGCMQSGQRSASPTNPGTQANQPVSFNKSSQYKEVAKYQGPYGEPIPMTYTPRGAMPGSPGLVTADYVAGSNPLPGDIMRADFFKKESGKTSQGTTGGIMQANYGDGQPSMPQFQRGRGITPVPGMGPSGAVAAIGALQPYSAMQPMNSRTSVRFQEPKEMKITWFGPNGWNDTPLTTPARYNFLQGGIYRLKLSQIPNKPDVGPLYPTLEVLPVTAKSSSFLAHSSVPVAFSDDDIEQVSSGNYLVKVIYLPDPTYQDFASVVGPNELVSTRLEPGVDPIVEAQKRGTILLIVRMGNINLEDRNTPAMDTPNPFLGAPRGPMNPGMGGGMMPIPQPKVNPKMTGTEPPKFDTTGRPSTLPMLP